MSLLDDLADVGRAAGGGYARHGFDRAEAELREWFREQAGRSGLDVETDRNGNLWAWWGEPGRDALVTGSHLDSVPGGGAFDGPLGVAGALAAVSRLRGRGFTPARPFAVVVFAEEEGGRFGVPCLGSRLLTGALDADRARALRDPDGVTLAEAAERAGVDPARFGRDDVALDRIGTFVELHIEQGRGLDVPVAVGSTVLEHGRWRFSFTGQGNHAGTTILRDRRDPMVPAAGTVLAARRVASTVDSRATVGRLVPRPGGTNVIPSGVDLWLDARGRSRDVVAEVTAAAERAAAAEGCTVTVTQESYGGTVTFDPALRERLTGLLDAPELATGAGHDAAILAAHAPAAMLYVRNPTGISHAPEEFAEDVDVEEGVVALARALESLST
ncbi:allantoate amidohydrolase [Amycolatopsis thermophila]|uniref:N-carbamoyl-L-amino-acid hydrolase n=1 Tax=Amycolatopsis thermophila TaxID=206084 RepID=A0ABU0EP76_9PSEU|nr:allantoate amidohydrolase [Amycolatopsis thermophila]MDQ0377097.1 N-carbamoyl-L-amino-acid hydrolase [Amycolatopsis thermophila]